MTTRISGAQVLSATARHPVRAATGIGSRVVDNVFNPMQRHPQQQQQLASSINL
jgi:hypothetical protein